MSGAVPILMGFCAENQVGLSFLTEHGRFLARVQGPVSGNVLLEGSSTGAPTISNSRRRSRKVS